MKTNNNFDMIGLIISLILSDDFTASVERLSSACGLPIPQMRKYISIIFKNETLRSHLSPTPEVNDEDDNFLKNFLNKIVSGKADTVPFYLIDMDDFIESYYLLPITSIESGYIGKIYPKLIQNQQTSLFEIKNSVFSIPEIILKRRDKIQEVISQKKKIEFIYKSPHFNITNVVCTPVSIIQNLTTQILYVKDSENKYYRIDRIQSDIKKIEEHSDIDQYIPSPFQKYFWGTEYQEHGNPVHVKLRISPETSNIIEKIRSDTALRNETGKLYKDGDFYYYEDDILGMPDFRRWIRSYGSSITVIEPQSLIDEIIEGVNKTLSYYEKL
jgi:hypothetical protein